MLRERLKGTSLEDCLEYIHLALTSEDVTSFAYGMMLSKGLGSIVIPALEDLVQGIEVYAQGTKSIPMLARTHGQAASPTTVGKEFKVFSSRLSRQLEQLKNRHILVKLNGATGNYNAHIAAYPSVDWLEFTRRFAERLSEGLKLKLSPNLITTQIEPHDNYAELFDNLRRINTIVLDFDSDMWRYISDGWFVQNADKDCAGSSTMPHKLNPKDFENSEGNLGIANALFTFFSEKLPQSRLQRDLSDSTVKRNFGVALAHSLIGYRSALDDLSKIAVNTAKVSEELENHPEIIAEALQVILRRENVPLAYESLKELTRGKRVTLEDLEGFISGLEVPEHVKAELRQVTPKNYIGLAAKLVDLDPADLS